jgi:predicted transglutaminase-like cysteine proteinase
MRPCVLNKTIRGLFLAFGISCLQPAEAGNLPNDIGYNHPVQLSSTSMPPLLLSLLDPAPATLASFSPNETPSGLPDFQFHSDPFGLQTRLAPPGALWTKWRKVEAAIEAEAPALARCRADVSRCSPAAARFVAIIKQASAQDGRARLELVNESINAAITYTTNMAQWNKIDVWSAPLDPGNKGSFDTGLGDCKDYAIAKYVALAEAGLSTDDLRLLVVRDTSAGVYHTVLAARVDGTWLILDNRWSHLVDANEAPFFTPLFAIGAEGVKRFVADDRAGALFTAHKASTSRRIYSGKPA